MRRTLGIGAIVFFIGAAAGVYTAVPASAGGGVINVDAGQNDTVSDDDLCSLPEALANAENNTQTHDDCETGVNTDDEIVIPADTITLTGDTDSISDGVTITGAGPGLTIIDGDDSHQIFEHADSDPLVVRNMTLQNGFDSTEGGAIYNGGGGLLEIHNVSFVGNNAEDGGAVSSDYPLEIYDSEFVDNNATDDDGGGVWVGDDYLIERTAFVGNTASDDGGGLYSNDNGRVRNTTFHDNTAGDEGGGWADNDDDEVFVEHVTFSANTAEDGANFTSGGGTVDFFATVFTEPQGDADDCTDMNVVNDNGYNVSSDESCDLDTSGTSQENVTDPGLDPIADNGGLGESRLPTEAGVLFDAVPVADCDPAITDDQRTEPRPVDGDEDGTNGCDIGAVEAQVPPPEVTTTATPTTAPEDDPPPAPAASPTVTTPNFTG